MAKLVVSSHNLKSNALRDLANELTKRIGYKVWRVKPDSIGNRHAVVFHAGINKVEQFRKYKESGVSIPNFVCRLGDVPTLDCKQVVVRSLIDSSEGKGITICKKEECTIEAPLYTEYIPKKKEYRVHVLDGKAIDVQEKRRRKTDGDTKEFQVRNLANGYVFCRNDVVPPADCIPSALAAVAALGRRYGAVDVVWNEKRNKCYVLEVNSRPGMQGNTLNIYSTAIMDNLPQDVLHPPIRMRVLKKKKGFRRA